MNHGDAATANDIIKWQLAAIQIVPLAVVSCEEACTEAASANDRSKNISGDFYRSNSPPSGSVTRTLSTLRVLRIDYSESVYRIARMNFI